MGVNWFYCHYGHLWHIPECFPHWKSWTGTFFLYISWGENRHRFWELPRTDSAPEPDKLFITFFTNAPKSALQYSFQILNPIWNWGDFPQKWKKAIVLPFLKLNKDPTETTTYNLISLTSVLAKIYSRPNHVSTRAHTTQPLQISSHICSFS